MWLRLDDLHLRRISFSAVHLDSQIRTAFLGLAGKLINKIEAYNPAAELCDNILLLDLTHKVISAFTRTRYQAHITLLLCNLHEHSAATWNFKPGSIG
jgi:hypothetical protein